MPEQPKGENVFSERKYAKLKEEKAACEKEATHFEKIVNEQADQLIEYRAKLGIFPRYEIRQDEGFVHLRETGEPYCANCLLQFRESQLRDLGDKRLNCPKCGYNYRK